MEQVFRVTPVIGLPQFGGWSHVWEQSLDHQTKCVVCFSVTGDNAGNIGRDIIETIQQLPPRSAQGLYQTVEDCVALAHERRCTLSVIAGIFRNKRSIFATYAGTVLLKRNQKVGRIVQSEQEIELIEGRFDTDDVFVFSTQEARQFLPQIELSFQRGFDSDGVITAIVPALHSIEDSSTSGLAFIAITEEEVFDLPAPPTVEFAVQTSDEATEPLIRVTSSQTVAEGNKLASTAEGVATGEALGTASPQRVESNSSQRIQLIFSQFAKGVTKTVAWIWKLLRAFFVFCMNVTRMFSSKTYVGGQPSKKALTIGIGVLIIILISLIAFFVIRSNMRRATAEAEAAAEPFRTQLTEVVAQAEHDPIPARERSAVLIESIKTAQSEAESQRRKRTAQELAEVLAEAQTIYQDISGRDEVSELPIFYDLRLVTSDFISSVATLEHSTAIFIDDEKKEVVVLDTSTKQVFKIDVSSIGVVRAVTFLNENTALLLANGVYSLALEAGAVPQEIIAEGDSNRAATLTASFGSYVYVFNPEKRNIYRYVSEDDGYSDPVGWLLDPLGVPFDSVVSWAIDGDVWIGTEGGQILKFASGRSEEFAFSGMPEDFSSSLQIVTREDIEELYVLEAAKNRVVILSKDGEFLREVKSSSLGAATGLLVDSDSNTVYVVSGSTVFTLDVL